MGSPGDHALPATPGERQALVAAAILGLYGAVLGLVIAHRIGGGTFFQRGPRLWEVWLAVSGAVGAAGAFWVCRRQLGQRGLPGLVRALRAMLWITLAGPVIGGTLALPLYGTMFGPFAVAVTFWSAPFVACVWVATLVSGHVLMAEWQDERESLFTPRGSSGLP